MDENKKVDPIQGLDELLRHARGIGFAYRYGKIFDYLLWKWQQKRILDDASNPEMRKLDQAIDAFDECLNVFLAELEPETRVVVINLIEILNDQSEPH